MNKKLVLIGGGHASAIALKLWGLNPIPDVDLTLITDVLKTPYSGMLPGYVAGFYSYEQTHIDLSRLAKFAGAKLLKDPAIGLDLEHNKVICKGDQLEFDFLSIDIGSTPQMLNIPGAKEYAIPAKPVPQFLAAWSKLQQQFKSNPSQLISLVIVGGGAGGVELALNMQASLQRILNSQHQQVQIHLIHQGDRLLSGHNSWVSNKLQDILIQRDIQLHLKESVTEVLADQINCASGLNIKYDAVFWVTQATAPHWIKNSQLSTDEGGFILVKDTLASVSHPHVLAAGDIATMINYQRPKAGVFAVRQGKPLLANWRCLLTEQPLQTYTPQSKYLALIGTGDGKAIASWGNWGWRSQALWWMKDYIDRRFMKQFLV